MKKNLKVFIRTAVCLAVLISIVSCGIHYPNKTIDVPDGYTGGIESDRHFHELYETKWLETYDELMTAVTLLKTHGCEISQEPIFNCEEFGIDTKFCITFTRNLSEKLENGKDYFDRKLHGISITQYIFFENVSIKELEYSMWDDYIAACVRYNKLPDDPDVAEDVKISRYEGGQEYAMYDVFYNGELQFGFSFGFKEFILTEEQIKALEQSIELIK